MDSELYKRILCSKNFQTVGKTLREEIADLTKNLLIKVYHPSLIEAFVSSRLIPLDKNPGIRPIGVGEVLRRIIGRIITRETSDIIKEAAGALQTCAGFGAGAEAAIHVMRQTFDDDINDAVLLIDVENAFNCMNRAVALHNTRILCQIISTYLVNTYRHATRLFISGGGEIKSTEGTTQGDPLAMAWYSINTVMIIDWLAQGNSDVKQVWLADDATTVGTIENLKTWYERLIDQGKKFGYYVNCSKCWLIVKSKNKEAIAEQVFGDSVKITTDGKRHLGAVIGSKEYKDAYCNEKIDDWKHELEILCKIAKTQPQAAYIAYTKEYKSKFAHFFRTIDNFESYIAQIDDLLKEKLIPSLFGIDSTYPFIPERYVLSLPTREGGLGIPLLYEQASQQFDGSKLITKHHVKAIINQKKDIIPDDNCDMKQLKNQHTQNVKNIIKQQITDIKTRLPYDTLRYFDQAREKGASSWLNALPLSEQGFDLTKTEFRDALCLTYNLKLNGLPSFCPCRNQFNVTHALSCKKGGFVSKRHDNIKDTLTILLDKVCHVMSEPPLIPIEHEQFKLKSANTANEARLDIKASDFWQNGQTAFFDIRVTHVNADSNKNKTCEAIYREHEQ